jgi:ribosome biogenesis protein Nip4
LRLLVRLLRDLGSAYSPDESGVLRINDKYFTLSPSLSDHLKARRDLVYAGRYLGRDRRVFQPSALTLEALAVEPGTRKVHVGRGAAWLFVCGRDLFQESVEEAEPGLILGAHYLVVYDGRCVGYGRYETAGDRRIIRNLFDIGDFLRREK